MSFYRTGTFWYKVRFDGQSERPHSEPEIWFSDPLFIDTWLRSQVLSPDGSVVYLRGAGQSTASYLRVIPNWVRQMKRAVDEVNR
jgi:hypothetical protein